MEMNKRGFIVTITTFYYVAIFIAFLGLLSLSLNYSFYSNIQDSLSTRTMSRLVTGIDSDIVPLEDHWCAVHVLNYDANENLSTQSDITYKIYCEDYNAERIV